MTLTDGVDVIMPEYARVKITPLRRSTQATVLATAPNRVNGLRGFRLEALVMFGNK